MTDLLVLMASTGGSFDWAVLVVADIVLSLPNGYWICRKEVDPSRMSLTDVELRELGRSLDAINSYVSRFGLLIRHVIERDRER